MYALTGTSRHVHPGRRRASRCPGSTHRASPGRSTIWLHPSIPLRFEFDTPERPALNAHWIEEMMRSVNSSGGINLLDEVIEPL
jgi:hypothetical protein